MEWMKIGEEDYGCKEGFYQLRVEQMDVDYWWFAVYFKGEEIYIDKNFSSSKKEAMKNCETEYVNHLNQEMETKHLKYNIETGRYQCQYKEDCKIPKLDTVTGSSCLTCKLKENETQR